VGIHIQLAWLFFVDVNKQRVAVLAESTLRGMDVCRAW